MTRLNPRIVLRHLIERLQPEVGNISRKDFGVWEGEGEAALKDLGTAGRLHLAEALLEARQALASGDDEQIAEAEDICLALEQKGRELEREVKRAADAARVAAEQAARQKGGARTGAKQRADAVKVWAKWVAMYRTELGSDKNRPARTAARNAVAAHMVKEEFTLPSGEFPSPSVLRKWLR